MDSNNRPNGRRPLSVDFDSLRRRLGEIARDADSRLQNLLSTPVLQSDVEKTYPLQSFSADSPPDVSYEFRFGSTQTSRQELDAIALDSVVPLDQTEEDGIQIYADGRLVGKGALIIIDGKLALRVLEIDHDDDSD